MKVNPNKVIDALELLRAVTNKLDYCPDLFEVQRLLIESLAPAPKIDTGNIDDELVEVTESGFGRIFTKPTNQPLCCCGQPVANAGDKCPRCQNELPFETDAIHARITKIFRVSLDGKKRRIK